MTIRNIDEGWTLTFVDGPAEVPEEVRSGDIPAAVPGCVHTDLLTAGLIEDPYVDDVEHGLHWIGWSDWLYRTSFEVPRPQPGERVDLVFEGLDTVAEIAVNGTEIARTANMHRTYRFDVTERLLPDGDNELTVRFASPEKYALAEQDRLGGPYPCAEGRPYSFIRKMACNFRWDWGPDLVTSGLWRPVRLHTWRVARLADVRPQVTVDSDGNGRVRIPVEVERLDHTVPLEIEARVARTTTRVVLEPGSDRTELEVVVPRPDLWWPHGHGAQPLYELGIRLSDADGRTYDRWQRRVGFRRLELDTTPDERGTPFTFVVNGRRIFANGVNWIPDDCFPSRIDRTRYETRLRQAKEAHVNLVRVWGGGIYESDDFYDVCDELGILAWQDFLFTCAGYNEEALAAEVEAEARDNVARLVPHPSLAIWNANNETIWGWFDGDWSAVGDRTWGLGFYLDLLPRVVTELDPDRPFWGGSPYSGSMELHPNDEAHGLTHVWDVWNDVDYPEYRRHRPRFASEFGFQGPATYATLARAVTDRPLTPDSPAVLNRQRAANGVEKLRRGLAAHFDVPEDFDDWHYLAQVNQARALATGIEHFRSLQPDCTGTAWWQFNDCWPVHSWACVDGDGRPKPAWYALRRAYAPRLLTVQPGADGLRVVVLNTTAEPWQGDLHAERLGFDGTAEASHGVEFACPAYGKTEIVLPRDVAETGRPTRELVRVRADAEEALWFFARDRELDHPPAKYDVTVSEQAGRTDVTVTARTFLRDLCLFADRLDPDASTDRALVTLLPGETTVFRVGATGLPATDLGGPPVLRCVGDQSGRTGES